MLQGNQKSAQRGDRNFGITVVVFSVIWVWQTELAAECPGAGPAIASPRVRRLRFVWTKLSFAWEEAQLRITDSAQGSSILVGGSSFLRPDDRLTVCWKYTMSVDYVDRSNS